MRSSLYRVFRVKCGFRLYKLACISDEIKQNILHLPIDKYAHCRYTIYINRKPTEAYMTHNPYYDTYILKIQSILSAKSLALATSKRIARQSKISQQVTI